MVLNKELTTFKNLNKTDMKITVNTTVAKEIELPRYFKTADSTWWMLCGENAVVKVHSYSQVCPELGLLPKIEAMEPSSLKHYIKDKFEHISEAEFKLAYTRVSIEIEDLMN